MISSVWRFELFVNNLLLQKFLIYSWTELCTCKVYLILLPLYIISDTSEFSKRFLMLNFHYSMSFLCGISTIIYSKHKYGYIEIYTCYCICTYIKENLKSTKFFKKWKTIFSCSLVTSVKTYLKKVLKLKFIQMRNIYFNNNKKKNISVTF